MIRGPRTPHCGNPLRSKAESPTTISTGGVSRTLCVWKDSSSLQNPSSANFWGHRCILNRQTNPTGQRSRGASVAIVLAGLKVSMSVSLRYRQGSKQHAIYKALRTHDSRAQCHLSSGVVEDPKLSPKCRAPAPSGSRQRLQGPCICLLVARKRDRQLSVSTIQIRRVKISASFVNW